MQAKTNSTCLVTGATGFVSSHVIKLLLENDYKVRATVRSLANKNKYEFLYDLVPEKKNNLEVVEAELTNKDVWLSVVEGCEYVFHVASPIGFGIKDEDIIAGAVDGTLTVLEASLAKKVKRVVFCSSAHTIYFGSFGRECTEDDWGNDQIAPAYPKSKILAEKAAWKFYEENKDKIELAVVCPGLILGPSLTNPGVKMAERLVSEMIKGDYPGAIDISMQMVDVRDVAQCHLNAMFTQAANGRRYNCGAYVLSLEQLLETVKGEFGKYGYDIKTQKLTADEAKASGNALAAMQVPMIGKKAWASNERVKKELGMTFRPYDKMIIDMGYTLIKYGIVEDKVKNQ